MKKGQSSKNGTIKSSSFEELKEKIQNRFSNQHPIGREINLVPDVKEEMIKAIKLRNLIFFICIVVASASTVLILVFASIAAGQQAIADSKKTTIANLSAKVNSYSDLNDFLTIKDQLSNLSELSDNKKLLSRTFSVLSALLPTGADKITISELNINLSDSEPTISFDAQANAGEPPYIDYNVLDSFKKSMKYMRYDYGSYVDKEGATIPAYCIIENGTDGATLYESGKGYYAYWLITGEGCNPTYESKIDTDDNVSYVEADAISGYTVGEYNGNKVVKIWRTPQFNDWYKKQESASEPYMNLDGEIVNVAHFESECITYSGAENKSTGEVTWSSSNDSCLLVPDGDDGIKISNSSNGRDSSGDLVLRFSTTITLNSEVFAFGNSHMIAIAPSGRYNVTDSYVQIQNMFEERATDCSSDDTACANTTEGGE